MTTSIEKKGLYSGIINILTIMIVCCTVFFHLWTASFGVYPAYFLSAVHWALIGSFIIINKPLKFPGGRAIDLLLLIINVFICIYEIRLQQIFVLTAGVYSRLDIYISIAALFIAIIIGIRIVGVILPVIAALFVLYGLYGRYFPGMFKTVRFTMQRLAPYLYTSADGIFGQTMMVSAQFIYLFVFFGCVLEITGAGEFFVDTAFSVAGRARGGPAQAAAFSSMLMGTINGSGAANVVTTGTFTIPLMKKVGFPSEIAGAVEAVASSGGQIMPPVMGAVAFLMAELTGIGYGEICVAALIPAILYYIALSASVYFNARRMNMKAADIEDIRKTGEVLKKGWLYLVPLVVLIVLMVKGYSPQRAVFVTILVTIAVGFIKNRKNMTLKNFYKAALNSVKSIAPIAGACLLAGVIMGIINMTGLGLKISGIIQTLSQGRLIIALVLSMITSLILGMGLPTSAAYMILAVLVAPALISMGATVMAAHLFILYFGALSTITPPVALSTLAAAAIAESNIWSTGKESVKFASTGFVIPFIWVYNNELLMSGTPLAILMAILTAIVGCFIVSMSLAGWAIKKLHIIIRVLLFPCGVMLFIADPFYWNLVGLTAAALLLLIEVKLLPNKGN
jgi:TRAP transporter 4TM/12TM fusion protein